MTKGERGTRAIPPGLVAEIAAQSSRPVAPAASLLVKALQQRFGESLVGVLLYGSCLHRGDLEEGLVDAYALVNDYREAYPRRLFRIMAAALPPNVHYVEAGGPEGHLRAKVAVVSMDTFEKGTRGWFHPYLWARFAQPCRVLYADEDATLGRIHHALARAVSRFHEACVPALGDQDLDAKSIWTGGLRLSYAAELRAEKDRAPELVRLNLPDYERLTSAALPGIEDPASAAVDGGVPTLGPRLRRRALRAWWLRRQQGRVLSVLRLAKALVTFENGPEYLVWKIERHSGVEVEITPRLRRYPLLLGPWVLWQLLRRGVVR